MFRNVARVFALVLLSMSLGCHGGNPQQPEDHPLPPVAGDVSMLLSVSTEHPWLLNCTVTNVSNHPVHVAEVNGELKAKIHASQGNNVVWMLSAMQWRYLGVLLLPRSEAAIMVLQPNETIRYSLDLLDYTDDFPTHPEARTLQTTGVFSHQQPVDVWATVHGWAEGPDQKVTAAGDCKSNTLCIDLRQWDRQRGPASNP